MLLAGLIHRELSSMVNYINGMVRLRRITLQGDGTKKSPYYSAAFLVNKLIHSEIVTRKFSFVYFLLSHSGCF